MDFRLLPPGPITLLGLGGKVSAPRLLHDGSEVSTKRRFNALQGAEHEILDLGEAELPDPAATVIALRLDPGL